MTVKAMQQHIISAMRDWQKTENASIASTGRVIEETENPVIRLAMEIIQHDSQMHYRVQELIAASLEKEALVLTPGDLAKVWEMIERHVALENKMMNAVNDIITSLKGKRMVIQEYLLNYLLEDEKKHLSLLQHLEVIKKGMLP